MLILAAALTNAQADTHFPADEWRQYDDPSKYGWSIDALAEARAYADANKVATVMIVENGYVVAGWGDLERRYMCHSLRKSFMSALIGIHEARGEIALDATVADLGIDDIHQLSATEKSARVSDLLKARSGVYHTAAYETDQMKAQRPARNTFAPNMNYYYNNWDFNVLSAIFQQQTGRDTFEAFASEIAEPIGMEDFRLADTYYHLEPQHSQFPAYPFVMSTRDAARFGLLYLAMGKWKDQQLIPARWIHDSQVAYSRRVRTDRGYGYLWWISEEPTLAAVGMYHAAGVGGQIIAILPAANLVIVQRVNTYVGDDVPYAVSIELMKKILGARDNNGSMARVRTVPLPKTARQSGNLDRSMRRALEGTYLSRDGKQMISAVETSDHELALRFSAGTATGKPALQSAELPTGQTLFVEQLENGSLVIADAMYPVTMVKEGNRVVGITIERRGRALVYSRQGER